MPLSDIFFVTYTMKKNELIEFLQRQTSIFKDNSTRRCPLSTLLLYQ